MLLLVVGLCMALAFRTGWFLPSEEFEPPEDPPVVHPRDGFYGLAVPDEDVIWLAGNLGKILRSEDGGETWRLQKTPVEDLNLQDIAAWDTERAVVVGDSNTVLLTEDAGETWRQIADHPEASLFGKLIRVETTGEGRAVAAGQGGMVMLTEDGGENWHRVHPDQRATWNDVDVPAPDRIVTVGEFGQVGVGVMADTAEAADGVDGVRWTEVNTPLELSLKAVDFRDARRGVAVGLSGSVLYTDNGGDSWAELASGTGEHFWDVTWEPTRGRWLAVGDAGYVSTWRPDAGDTQWTSRRLAGDEFGWHTESAPTGDSSLLVGENVGTLKDDQWQLLPNWRPSTGEDG